MDEATRKRLEAAGWRSGDAEDFLGLTEDERREVARRAAEQASGPSLPPPHTGG